MVKSFIKKNKIIMTVYQNMKKITKEYNDFHYSGKFENRSHNEKYLCIILAGYKPFLMENVLDRINRFGKENMDVCVITSGLYSYEISQKCKNNGWSYLSTKENNVSLVQNIAIHLHPFAQYIFKLDEDIFITENYFDRMLHAYHHAEKSEYFPGIVAPLLNVNGYSYVRILEKLGLKEVYKNAFEMPKYAAGPKRMLENDSRVAEFMWGGTGDVPQIDDLNAQLWNTEQKELACPIRFSIGAILFKRELWENMGYFNVNRKTNAMGADEAQICEYCVLESRPIMVSENIVVGHFSFGPQTNKMKDFYRDHRSLFEIHNGQSSYKSDTIE